jgi:hypothetical protein
MVEGMGARLAMERIRVRSREIVGVDDEVRIAPDAAAPMP